MNREEQIKEAAEKYLNNNDSGLDYIGASCVELAFQDGAQWADEHREVKHKKFQYVERSKLTLRPEVLEEMGKNGFELCLIENDLVIFKREIL